MLLRIVQPCPLGGGGGGGWVVVGGKVGAPSMSLLNPCLCIVSPWNLMSFYVGYIS